MTKLQETRGTQGEQIWVVITQIIGLFLVVAALFKPLRSMFIYDAENIPVTYTNAIMAVIGFFIVRGGKQVGTVINNIGAIINTKLTKLAGIEKPIEKSKENN